MRATWGDRFSCLCFEGRAPKTTERLTRLFFASDFHGSQRIFRKFMNAAKHYEADVLDHGR